HFQRTERSRDVGIAEENAAQSARTISNFPRRPRSSRRQAFRRDRARGRKVIPLSRQRLPDLLRTNAGRNHHPPRPAQEHVSGFPVPQQTAGRGRPSARQNPRVLETDRAGRENAKVVKAMLSFWKAAALGLTGYVLGSAMVIVIAQMHKDSWLSGGIIAAMSLPVAAIQFVF